MNTNAQDKKWKKTKFGRQPLLLQNSKGSTPHDRIEARSGEEDFRQFNQDPGFNLFWILQVRANVEIEMFCFCHNVAKDLIHSGEDGEVLDEPVDDGEEDGGGGDDDQQPLLVPLPVLGGDPSGADGDEEAGGEGDLQCVPVGGACLCKVQGQEDNDHFGERTERKEGRMGKARKEGWADERKGKKVKVGRARQGWEGWWQDAST